MISWSFSCRLWGGVTALALCASLGQAQFLDHNDLRTAIGTSTVNGTVTLPFNNFYVRTRVNCTVGDPNFVAGANVRVVGFSYNPNNAPLGTPTNLYGKPLTRIVGGIPIPEYGRGPNGVKTADLWGSVRVGSEPAALGDLPTDDPWHAALTASELASGQDIYWIDLDHFATKTAHHMSTSMYAGAPGPGTSKWEEVTDDVFFWRWEKPSPIAPWRFAPWTIPMVGTKITDNSVWNLATLTMDGNPMRFAELGDTLPASVQHSTWGRVEPEIQPILPPGGGGGGYQYPHTRFSFDALDPMCLFNTQPGGQLPSDLVTSLAPTTDMLCQVFYKNDYQPVIVPVNNITGLHKKNRQGQFIFSTFEVTLGIDPWLAGLEGPPVPGNSDGADDFSHQQRFKLLNSPQFLRKPGHLRDPDSAQCGKYGLGQDDLLHPPDRRH